MHPSHYVLHECHVSQGGIHNNLSLLSPIVIAVSNELFYKPVASRFSARVNEPRMHLRLCILLASLSCNVAICIIICKLAHTYGLQGKSAV